MTASKTAAPHLTQPDHPLVAKLVAPSVVDAKAYFLDIQGVPVKLDQNESPWDWPESLKRKVLDKVMQKAWNRYPDPMAQELHDKLAAHLHLPPQCLLTGPGSNFLITLIIEAFFRHAKGKRVIARPSFALFESHTKMLGIPYETWDLDQDLKFDLARFPELPSGSVFMFASPNNPTGTVLPRRDLEALLRRYPDALFIADEAYVEFSDEPYSELLQHYNNLLIIRTMSKTTGAAGVRLGYVIGPAAFISQVTKLRLPYLLNHFNVAASLVMLEDPEMQQFIKRNVTNAKAERERIYGALQKAFTDKSVTLYPSGANFLLIRCRSVDTCRSLYKNYLEQGVLVRDVGGQPGLAGCLRLTIGLPAENDKLVEASTYWYP